MNTRSIPLNGLALKSARANAGLLQRELAVETQVTTNTIWRLENETMKCSLKLLNRLAAVLNVALIDLVHDDFQADFLIGSTIRINVVPDTTEFQDQLESIIAQMKEE